MVAFYNPADQELYKKYQYLPQEQYRLGLNLPKTEQDVSAINTSFGIPATTAFTNNRVGGGGALQVGDPMMNFDNYYNYTGNKYMQKQATPLVNNLYQSKLDKSFLGFPSYRQQQLTGPDLGEYIGTDTDVPLEQTIAGNIQSKTENITGGIKNLMDKVPSITGLLNKIGVQNFSSLSPADQTFIQTNAGYTGPTIFGENTTGISKDPFGRNVESIGGNYAQKVRDDFEKLSINLSPTGVIGKKDAYQGATFDPVSGTFKADDEDDPNSVNAAAYANKMNKMNLTRYRYDKKAITQQEKNQSDIEKAAGVRDTIAARNFISKNPNYGDPEKNKNPGSGGGKGYDPGADYSGSDKRSQDNRSSDLGFSDIRLKENVELIGKSPSNINIYKFNYKNSPTTYQGAMAHEVPWASIKHSNGYMMVDYNQIDVNFKKI